MILDDLLIIVKNGANIPLDLWWSDLKEKEDLAKKLDKIVKKLESGTRAQKNTDDLARLIVQDNPDELEVAKKLSYVADIFLQDENGLDEKTKQKAYQYSQFAKQMYGISQQSYFHQGARQKLKDTLSEQEQKEYDVKLFKHEGMNYCLEYYLAIYKKIQDTDNLEEKRKYIESDQINLGFGELPGLWADFNKDEVLTKFIYSILDDEVRNDLVRAYFDTKHDIMKIHMNCDKQGVCSAEYGEIDLNQVIDAFRALITKMMDTFISMGITNLSSLYFKPYGDKPSLQEVKTQI